MVACVFERCLRKECFHELNEHRLILITLHWLSEKQSHVMILMYILLAHSSEALSAGIRALGFKDSKK